MQIKQLNATTYEINLPTGDKVEIGDKEALDFKPHIKLNRWGKECSLKLGLSTTEKVAPIVEANKVKWCGNKAEVYFYPLEPRTVVAKDKDGSDVEFTQNELGGFEFEVVLKQKPDTNKISLDIETQGLKFYYQPLEPIKPSPGAIVLCPDNVRGSYAVYHRTRTNIHSSEADANKYKAGKAFHIYRPKVVDAKGNWTWGELSVDDQAGTLEITIKEDWLDRAVYPVLIDPNFGYETKGSQSDLAQNYLLWGTKFTCPESGTAQSITAYVKVSFATIRHWRYGLYTDSDGSPNAFCRETEEASEGNFDDWKTLDLTSTYDLSNAAYWLEVWASTTNAVRFYRDTGDANQGMYNNGQSYHDWPDPQSANGYNYQKLSIYCTYTTAGATEKNSSDTGSGADAKASGNPMATLVKAETGSGTDVFSNLLASLVKAETGSGVETPGDRLLASAESGQGVEAAEKSEEGAEAKSSSDTGSGLEAILDRALVLGETGSGVGVSSLLVALIGTGEAGLGSEFASKLFSAVDSGSGIDAVVARLLAATETGSALEAALLSGALPQAVLAGDEGSGFDKLRALIEIPTVGSDMRLPTSQGRVTIPSKEVNL